jgi:hypothetical protein
VQGSNSNPISLNLLVLLPDFTPQKSQALVNGKLAIFITNSFVSLIILCEKRLGRTEIYVIGGSEFIIPVHAIVNTFAFSIVPQVTITGGTGKSIVPGFQVVFAITYPFQNYWTLPKGLTLFCAS